MVTRDTDRLRTTIYGKLTHAHRLLTLMQTKLTFLFAVLRKYFMISMIRSNFYNKIKTDSKYYPVTYKRCDQWSD